VSRKQITQLKIGKELEDMPNRHMKHAQCHSSLILWEMQFKILSKRQKIRASKDVEKTESFHTVGEN
jgi:hypothetical protein